MSYKLSGLLFTILVTGTLLFAGCTSPQSGSGATGPIAVTSTPGSSADSILVYSGAGLKAPMQDLGQLFTEKYGTEVRFTWGGSGMLISQMNLTQKGDVFITGSTVEYNIAKGKGFVDEPRLVAYHVPVIAVQKGNPRNILTIQDFARPGLKIALGDTGATAIGKAGQKMFEKYNITDEVEANVITRTPTINELTVIMHTGQADAAILTLDQIDPDKVDAVPIPITDNAVLIIPIGVTGFSQEPKSARLFAEFVASDEGKAVFADHGFPAYPDPAYAGVKP